MGYRSLLGTNDVHQIRLWLSIARAITIRMISVLLRCENYSCCVVVVVVVVVIFLLFFRHSSTDYDISVATAAAAIMTAASPATPVLHETTTMSALTTIAMAMSELIFIVAYCLGMATGTIIVPVDTVALAAQEQVGW